MKIIMTNEFRKKLVLVLNVFRNIVVGSGFSIAIFFALMLDSMDPVGTIAVIGSFIGLAIVLVGMLIEIINVMCLVHDNEHINTIFNFSFYGLRSTANYKDYRRRVIRARMIEQRALKSNKDKMAI